MPRKNKIIIRTGSAAPTASDFVAGEPAWDSTNSKLYIRNASGVMSEVGAGGGTTWIYEYATTASFPSTGTSARIYIATDTSRAYRWDATNSAYVEIGAISAYDSRFDLFLPAAPTGVTATAGDTQATVLWTAPSVVSATPVTDYIVQYSSNSGSTWTTFSDGTSTSTSATVTGLTNGTNYVFRVAAVNGIGTGSYSSASAAISPVAGDPYFSSVILLLKADGSGSSFVDSSNNAATITAYGDTTQSAAQSKWGGKSAYFDGNGDSLTVASSASVSGTGDFTIEFWARPTAFGSGYCVWLANDTSYGFATSINSNGTVSFGRSLVASDGTTSNAVDFGQWNHVALCRSSGTLRIYINGVKGYDAAVSTSFASGTVRIGTDGGGSALPYSGYIDDLRITTVARYTGSTIAVPTAAFPTS